MGGGVGVREGEREEMVGQRLVQHLKKKRHTQEKDVKYECKGGGGWGDNVRERGRGVEETDRQTDRETASE